MSTAPAAELSADDDLGRLANNGITVTSLQSTLSKGESNARLIPKLILRIAKDDAWRAFVVGHAPDRVHRWNAAEFRRFIESPRPEGCQTPIHVLERMVRDTEAWPVFLALMRGEPGGANNPFGRTGKPAEEIKYSIGILDSDAPTTIPMPALPLVRKPPCGNTTSYTLRQLERGVKRKGGEVLPARPDLLERVKSGELSPNAAAVQAGFRPPAITLPAEPRAAVRILVRHFKDEALETLIHELANWAGFDVTPKPE